MLLNCGAGEDSECPLDSMEIKPVNPKGNQPWIFIGKTYPEAPILWPANAKSWLIGKDPDAGKDWGQEEKGMTEDETVGWHHWLNRHKFEQTPGDSEGQGSLECCSSWGCKESDMTWQMKSNSNMYDRIHQRTHLGLTISLSQVIYFLFSFFNKINLFRISISLSLHVSKLCLLRNFSISSRLSNFWA